MGASPWPLLLDELQSLPTCRPASPPTVIVSMNSNESNLASSCHGAGSPGRGSSTSHVMLTGSNNAALADSSDININQERTGGD